jgi:hypothetical protein
MTLEFIAAQDQKPGAIATLLKRSYADQSARLTGNHRPAPTNTDSGLCPSVFVCGFNYGPARWR